MKGVCWQTQWKRQNRLAIFFGIIARPFSKVSRIMSRRRSIIPAQPMGPLDKRANDRVLVGVMNNARDLEIARTQRWYRIPIDAARKWVGERWPPQWLAFYQTKAFATEPCSINYYAPVREVRQVTRAELFPDEPENPKTGRRYFQVMLGAVEKLSQPILSRRWRRIVFIRTTWQKFRSAAEVNDLYDESPLEDRLWAELKRRQIQAERQEFVTVNGRDYALDFAFYCARGKLAVETDGDIWHGDRARIPQDNLRDNDLETAGWKLLRFNTLQLNDAMVDYCVPTIVNNLNALGGLEEGRVVPRDLHAGPSHPSQLSLFDD
jgi:very-short-patch-repair endonuclease